MHIAANTYFSGAGLMDIGLGRGGVSVQQSFEIDAVCCATQRLNFSHEVVQCDLTKKLVAHERGSHVRVFTYPCTKYSGIAAIHGCQTGDDLYLHALRHMVIDPPEIYVAENVPGLRKFPLVMEVMTRLPDYFVTVFCPVQSQLWLPQKRDRVFIIGSRRPFAWRVPAAPAIGATPLKSIVDEDAVPEFPDYVHRRLRGEYRDRPIVSDPARGDIAPCCVAHYAKDRSTRLVVTRRYPNGRPYTVREYARLQGVPESFQFAGTESDAFRQIGNGVSIPPAEWVGREICRYFNN